MCSWTTGRVAHVMTAVIQYLEMSPITVNIVTESTARNVRHIARNVTPQYVLDVLINVPHVKYLSVKAVLLNARNAKSVFVWIV